MAERQGTQAIALRQLTALNRIARIALEDLELRPMLQRIVDTLHEEFGWEFVACASVDRERGEFCCEALYSGLETEVAVGYRRPLGSGVVGECAQSGHTIEIEDVRGQPNFVDTLHGTRSELCVPVRHGDEVLAVLNVESRRVGAFRGQRALLETVADQIAGALRAAHLFAALQRTHAELRDAYATVEALSRNDSLTGIANRRSFDAWMARALADAREAGTPLSLILIDVDYFKRYNDGYGHLAGDHCLQQVAGVLAFMVDGTPAQLARYGGEEFVVLLRRTELPTALALAERLRLAVQARALEHGFAPAATVTISAGVAALAPRADDGLDALLRRADAALYEAKRGGRNRVAAGA